MSRRTPEPPRKRPGPPESGIKLEALDNDGMTGLLHLHEDIGGIEGPGHPLAPSFPARAPVPEEPPPPRPVPAPEGGIGHVRGRRGHPLGHHGGQRPQHGLEDPVADQRAGAAARPAAAG